MTEKQSSLIEKDIVQPTLVLDEARVVRNIERMVRRAQAAGVTLRPHFKTHQSAEIGVWFAERGVRSITVSSLSMAHYFAKHGWSDITVAFPINLREMVTLNVVARAVDLGLLIDNEPVVQVLEKKLLSPARAWIKIDAGYGRAGIIWHDHDRVALVAAAIQQAPGLELRGLLVHSGDTYQAGTADEVRQIHATTVSRLVAIQDRLRADGIPVCEISVGDTPSCSLVDDFAGVDEIRPGNFVFHDLMQRAIGACDEQDIAVAVACPVVGTYAERGQVVIYGGAVHLGKEALAAPDGRQVFGYLIDVADGKLGAVDSLAPVVSLSQEHGVVQVSAERLARLSVGDLVYVAPVHSCLTCNMFDGYAVLSGGVIMRSPRSAKLD